PADLRLAGGAPLPLPGLRAGEPDDGTALVEHRPQAEAPFGVVPALAGGELLVDRQLRGPAALELHDVGVGEDAVPDDGVLMGGHTEPHREQSSSHGSSPSDGWTSLLHRLPMSSAGRHAVFEPWGEPAVTEPLSDHTADVIVVGAGPAGSTTAYHLARSGLDVLLLEKTEFPREKVCGDGLTPRAPKQLVAMGIDISEEAGWLRNKGLRIIGGGVRLQLDWPELASFPDYGLVRKRDDFDEQLARQAQKAGARLYERCNVGAPVIDDRT